MGESDPAVSEPTGGTRPLRAAERWIDDLFAAAGISDETGGLDAWLDRELPDCDRIVLMDCYADESAGQPTTMVVTVSGWWPGILSFEMRLPGTPDTLREKVATLGERICWRERVGGLLPPPGAGEEDPEDLSVNLAHLFGVDEREWREALGRDWFPRCGSDSDGSGLPLLAFLHRPQPGPGVILGVTDQYVGIGPDLDEEWPRWTGTVEVDDPNGLAILASAVRRGEGSAAVPQAR